MNERLQAGAARRWCDRAARGLLLLASLWSAGAAALDPGARFHDYVLDNWNIESGLPQISVLSITQDGIGYMWIGTQNGIARFDGVRFVTYDRQSSGVDTTMATVAYTDRKGEPWFGTPHGALHYANGQFALLHAGRDNAAVQDIADDADGSLLFATSLGIMRYRNGKLEPAMLEGEPCYSLLRQDDVLWIGAVGTLIRIRPHDVTRYPLPASLVNARVSHLVADSDGLWLGTSAGLYRWNSGRIAAGGVDADVDRLGIESLYRDSAGNLWIGTAPMLFRLRPDHSIERIGADAFVRDSWVLSIYEDRERNLWLGSQTESLFRLWNGWARRISERDGLSDPFVWSIVRDPQNRIVLGTNSDIVTLGAHGVEELVSGKQLPNPSAYDLYYDSGGRLWIGTRGGIAIYANGKVERPPALTALDSYQINAIAQVGADYWIGSMGGLYRYRDDKLDRIGPAPGGTGARVRAIHALGADHLLIGTEAGLREVRGDSMQTPEWAHALDGMIVTYIAPIRPGLLGVTTLDAGFGLLADDRLLMLTSAQGLPSNNGWTFRVIDGSIYVAGIEGVWRLPLDALPDPASGVVHAVNPEMVLSASGRERGSQRVRCCNGGASARSAVDGDSIWLPTISGALRLDTRAIVTAQQQPNVVVEGLRHNGRWYAPGAIPELGGGSRDVEIDFTGLSFRDPRSLRFRYQLEGYDNAWVDAGARRAAFYTNLPPGNYRFRVQASLPDGIASGSDGTLTFVLPALWYELALVRAVLACAGIGLIAFLVMLRLRRYRAHQHRLELLVDERTHALSRANERLRLANQTLAQESQTDPLTDLHNRRFLLDHIHLLLNDGIGDGVALAFLLLDLDNFKRVNDEFGHAAGDSVLVQLAELLRSIARVDDYPLRWGGEEFLIVLKRVRPEQALETAERIRLKLAAHTFRLSDGRELRLTGSIGFAMHPLRPELRAGSDWTLTMELADAALYRVKQWGRNGSAGLVAGPALNGSTLTAQSLLQIDALVEAGALRWLRPIGASHLRLVRQGKDSL
ncbi:MAG: diguanylate cyclase [Rudaea sp.]|nr:diguanylate cyclase [Rudaea sp.]